MGPRKFTLHYFNSRGRAEIVRMLLAASGVDYEDRRYTPEEWAEFKPDTPFGALPILDIEDGMTLCQTGAIIQYLSSEFGFLGTSNLEAAEVHMVLGCMDDSVQPLIRAFYAETNEEKEKCCQEFATVQLPKLLEYLAKRLKGNRKYLVGDKLSVADIGIARCLSDIPPNASSIMNKYPDVDALVKQVLAVPAIDQWVKTRPETAG